MRRIATIAATAALSGAWLALSGATPAAPSAAGEKACATLAGPEQTGAKWVAADAAAGLPAYCEVTGKLTPAEGSSIGVVFRLPVNWNGKLLGIGGGGWAGNVTLQGASDGLRKGYATAQTDGGHPSTNVWDNSWASNLAARSDFAWRAIHEMTVAGKQLVGAYYGRPHERAYYQGCSTGGRMGLMAAQRFPEDFDAIIAGAPVYSLQVQSSAVLRGNLFARPGAAFSKADLDLVHTSVLARCDAADGLADGLVNAPRQCGWDPAVLQCKANKTASCLAPAQVAALRIAYDGVRAPDGSWAMLPMSRGGEPGWPAFVPTEGQPDATNGGGMVTLAPVLFVGAQVDYATLTPEQVLLARSSPFAKEYEATNSNLSGFFAHGGRLILWHGEDDPGPSPVGTNDYAAGVRDAWPERAATQFRQFLLPGVHHCGGGPGAFQVDWLAAMDNWVSSGTAPETVIGKRPDGPLTRKHCAWPKVARYSGGGEANDPASWTCS